MFNGIIKNTGIINRLYKKNNNCFLYILSKIKLTKKEIGSSISCSGACLTLEKYNRNLSKFYISKETQTGRRKQKRPCQKRRYY